MTGKARANRADRVLYTRVTQDIDDLIREIAEQASATVSLTVAELLVVALRGTPTSPTGRYIKKLVAGIRAEQREAETRR